MSPRMLELARERCAGTLELMDMRRLAFPDGSFDVVWANASLLHLPKADAMGALAELRRVTAPEGLVVVTVKRGDGERWEQNGSAPVRLFSRYEPAELWSALTSAGLEPESLEQAAGERRETWLHAVARCQAS